MADGISPNYAPPGLRHALLLEDHQDVTVTFDELPGEHEIFDGVLPNRLRGNKPYCVAIIDVPGHPRAIGYKPIPPSGIKVPRAPQGAYRDESDGWDMLCTQALGRALRRCGYPADLPSLKSVILWRQRQAEIALIGTGQADITLAPSAIENALTAAATTDPEGDPADDDTDDDAPTVTTGEGDLTKVPVTEVSDVRRKEVLNKLGSRQKELTAWCRERSWKVTAPANEAQARAIIAKGEELLAETQPALGPAVTDVDPDEPRAQDPGDDPVTPEDAADAMRAEIVNIVVGLDESDTHAWEVYLTSEFKDAKTDDPDTWPATGLGEMLGFLQIGTD